MNPMDNIPFQQVSNTNCTFVQGIPCDLRQIITQARQNPGWLEHEVQRINPQGYQKALQIRNSGNPRQAILQMAQANGVHPSILQMLNIR